MRRAIWLAVLLGGSGACTPIRPLDPVEPADAGTSRDARPTLDAPLDAPRDGGADACTPSAELCNGRDDDCDPTTPDGADDPALGMPCDGADGDACVEGTIRDCASGALVCDDATGDTPETCDFAATDEDCDGMANEEGAVGAMPYFADADRDGWGDDTMVVMACAPIAPDGTRYVTRGGDCDDADAMTRPGIREGCDAEDDDCDGMIDEGAPCPDACVTATYGGHTYLLCDHEWTWDEARTACEAVGYHLVKIEDTAESTWLAMECARRGIGGGFLSGAVWIGLRELATGWTWTDGSAATYFDWGAGEPNLTMSCARLRPAMGDWADQECTTTYAYACEVP